MVLRCCFVFVVAAVFCADASAAAVKVFVAPLKVGAGADAGSVALIEERVLVAARAHSADFEVVAARDVQAMVDVEATRQASGCESDESCAVEIAGALDAPQLVTGQVGRIGDTWLLTMTRTERQGLKVLARISREVKGSTPEGLLSVIDGAVSELLPKTEAPAAPVNVPLVAGGAVAGLGAVGLLVGTGAAAVSWQLFLDAEKAVNGGDLSAKERGDVVDDAEAKAGGTNTIALIGWIGGGAAVVVGAGLIGLGMMGGE